MKSLYKYVFIAVFLVVAASTVNSSAQELYGTGLRGFNGDIDVLVRKNAPGSFFSINPATGEATFIGDVGFMDCTGFDFHPITNVPYAACVDNMFNDSILVIIDLETGAGEFVGSLNTGAPFAFGVTDISFRSDGVLFATIFSNPSNILGTIDLETGNFSPLGPIGLPPFNGGLGFSLEDLLFYAGDTEVPSIDLFTLNQDNGSSTPVTNIALNPDTFHIESLETNPETGALFMAYRNDQQDFNSILSILDTDTGAVQDIGPTSSDFIRAIAFPNPVVRNIPTMSQYGLALAAVVLLAAALLVLRRRSYKSKA